MSAPHDDPKVNAPAPPPVSGDPDATRYGETPPVDPAATRYSDTPAVADPAATRYSDSPADPNATVYPPTPEAPAARLPRRFGGYELLGELGHGGMGVVYKARQFTPERLVALKVIRAGQLADEEDVRRFRQEADEAARLDHPNIVPVYEVGEQDGLHFFTMKLVEGGGLDKNLERYQKDPKAAARLLATAARAVHHAHQRQLLHRDLKPGNILLDAAGQPHVADFGLAKRLEGGAGMTQSNAVVGTPEYMAPEQARAEKRLTTAADVYALGGVLYVLLAGRPPFRDPTGLVLVKVLTEPPPPPSKVRPGIPRDLETICLKCLAKEPAKRYGSAEALAEDLERWLKGDPVQGRRVGRLERAWLWCRRNPGAAALVVAAAALLVLAAVSATVAASLYSAKADGEAKARSVLEDELYDKNISLAVRELTPERQDVDLASDLLEKCPERLRGWEWDYLMRLRDGDRPPLKEHDAGLWMAAFSPDGRRIATASIDGTAKVWDAASGRVLLTYSGHQPLSIPVPGAPRLPVMCIAFSPDGRHIASGSFIPNLFDKQKSLGSVKIWDAETGETVLTFEKQTGVLLSLAYSPDGKRIASSSINEDHSFVVWDARTGEVIQTLHGHASHVHRLRYSPDGRLIASASTDGSVKLWDAATFAEIRTIDAHPAPVVDVAFAPDGARFATAGEDGAVRVWDTATGAAVLTLRGHTGSAFGVAYSPDGRRIASAGFDKTVRLWDATTGKVKITLRGHNDMVWSVAFSPDGRELLSASFDSTARIWEAAPLEAQSGPGLFTLGGHTDHVNSVAFSSDGRYLASGGMDRTVRLWDGQSGQAIRTLPGHDGSVWGVAFSPDGKRLASASWDYKIKIWDTETGKELHTLLGHTAPVQAVAFSPDGKRVASAGWDGLVKIWDAETGTVSATCEGYAFPTVSVAFSPDGKRVASGQTDRKVVLWDAATGKSLMTLQGHKGAIPSVAFSPDGKRLVSASWDHTLKVWDVDPEHASLLFQSPEPMMTLTGHGDRVHCVAWSPDGTRIASGGDDKTVRVWDAATGKEVAVPHVYRGVVWSVAFGPDGKRIAAACWSASGWVKTCEVETQGHPAP